MTVYERLKFSFKFFGAFISFLTLIYEFFYFSKSLFPSNLLYHAYQSFMLIRLLFILFFSGYLCYRNYFKHSVFIPDEANLRPEVVDARKAQLKDRGSTFYLSLPMMLWFGLYRFYPTKDFMNLLVTNFVVELLLQSLPLTLIGLQATTLTCGYAGGISFSEL